MESEPYQRIIMNLRAVIDESGLKQKVVAERAGMKPAQLNNILCFRKRLDVAYIPVFCIILNTTPDKIYEGTISCVKCFVSQWETPWSRSQYWTWRRLG